MPRRSRLHTPKPHSRPGEKPDFSYLETSPAGAVPRPDVNARVREIGHLAVDLVRVLDGPVTLIRSSAGAYQVQDLLRNGVPMSDSIELFRNQERTAGDVSVRLDSLFMFPPNWQFNVVVRNLGSHDVVLDPDGAALFVDRADGFERIQGVITSSLDVVPAGEAVDGLMVFPAQRSADGRVLSLVYGVGPNALRFEFPLEDLVSVVPPPPPTDEETVEVAPS